LLAKKFLLVACSLILINIIVNDRRTPHRSIVVTPGSSLRPGTRLVREWRSRTHTVVVTEDGLEYAGKAFPSLTKIAHAITGAHWSGPRFFGLIRRPASNGQLRSNETGSLDAAEVANG